MPPACSWRTCESCTRLNLCKLRKSPKVGSYVGHVCVIDRDVADRKGTGDQDKGLRPPPSSALSSSHSVQLIDRAVCPKLTRSICRLKYDIPETLPSKCCIANVSTKAVGATTRFLISCGAVLTRKHREFPISTRESASLQPRFAALGRERWSHDWRPIGFHRRGMTAGTAPCNSFHAMLFCVLYVWLYPAVPRFLLSEINGCGIEPNQNKVQNQWMPA